MFWKRQRVVSHVEGCGGFVLGEIVRHKIDHVRGVIAGFDYDQYGPLAVVAFSSKPGDEADFHLAELEHHPSEPALESATPEKSNINDHSSPRGHSS